MTARPPRAAAPGAEVPAQDRPAGRDRSARPPGGAPHPLDNPAYSALNGPHARFARRHGTAVRYDPEVSVWAAPQGGPDTSDEAAWAELAALAGPDGVLTLTGERVGPPPGWETVERITGVQMVHGGPEVGPEAAQDLGAVRLGAHDVPRMLELVERTRPGPFLPRTVELGTYLGVWRDGELVAMAGERMRPAGWTEISAVCTDPAYRGEGLAGRLVLAVAAGVHARGEGVFLHASATNTNAIRLYGRLGFTLRRTAEFVTLRPPVPPSGPGRGTLTPAAV